MQSFELLTNATVHELVSPAATRLLQPLGFECVDRLKWVRSADAPVRQVLTFHKWKGGAIGPSWGVSLDFVPHVSAGHLKWHRTPKTALQDLRVDARNDAVTMSYIHGPDAIARRIDAVMRLALSSAQEFWSQIRSTADLLAACEWLKQYYSKSPGLGFYNYTQHPITLAFALSLAGRAVEAEVELETFIEAGVSFQRLGDQSQARLRALLRDCTMSPG